MKNLLLVLTLLLSFTALSQTKSKPRVKISRHFKINSLAMTSDSLDTLKINYYASASLSMSNTGNSTFSRTSYPSLEFGGMYEALGVGLVVGRSNLYGFKHENIQNYWYEVKTSFNQSLGHLNVYGIFGVGNYI